jgi:hypothetical protein
MSSSDRKIPISTKYDLITIVSKNVNLRLSLAFVNATSSNNLLKRPLLRLSGGALSHLSSTVLVIIMDIYLKKKQQF